MYINNVYAHVSYGDRLRQSRGTFTSLPEFAMNLQGFNPLIAVAARKSLSANTNSSAFAVAVHSPRLLRASKHYLRVALSRSQSSQIAFIVQRRTPRVGLYIGMFARVIVARPTLDTFLPESGFKKRLEPLMAGHLASCLTRDTYLASSSSGDLSHVFSRSPGSHGAHPGRR